MDSGNRLVCITVPRTRRRVNLARRFELVLVLVLEGVDLPRLSVGNWRSTPILQYSITPRGNSLEDDDERSRSYRPAVPQCNDTVPQVSDPEGWNLSCLTASSAW